MIIRRIVFDSRYVKLIIKDFYWYLELLEKSFMRNFKLYIMEYGLIKLKYNGKLFGENKEDNLVKYLYY